jgi:hypothetical protein
MEEQSWERKHVGGKRQLAHNTCTCKKEVIAGRKKRMHEEKEDLPTIVVRVFVGFL